MHDGTPYWLVQRPLPCTIAQDCARDRLLRDWVDERDVDREPLLSCDLDRKREAEDDAEQDCDNQADLEHERD